MIRKHEYRAYDKVEETMWTDVLGEMGDNDNYDDELSMWSVAYDMKNGDDSRFVFMEYINQNDVDGKKIFVDDVVDVVGMIEGQGRKGIVVFDADKSMYALQDIHTEELFPFYLFSGNVKILGDVHRNPDIAV